VRRPVTLACSPRVRPKLTVLRRSGLVFSVIFITSLSRIRLGQHASTDWPDRSATDNRGILSLNPLNCKRRRPALATRNERLRPSDTWRAAASDPVQFGRPRGPGDAAAVPRRWRGSAGPAVLPASFGTSFSESSPSRSCFGSKSLNDSRIQHHELDSVEVPLYGCHSLHDPGSVKSLCSRYKSYLFEYSVFHQRHPIQLG